MSRKDTKEIVLEVISYLGMTKREFSRRIGISEQALYKRMRANSPLRGEDVLRIESMTKGEFKRWYINSDIYPPEDYEEARPKKKKRKVRDFTPDPIAKLD